MVQIEIPFIQTTLAWNESCQRPNQIFANVLLFSCGCNLAISKRVNVLIQSAAKHSIQKNIESPRCSISHSQNISPVSVQPLDKSYLKVQRLQSRIARGPIWSGTQTPRLLWIPPPSAKLDLRSALNDANRNHSSSASNEQALGIINMYFQRWNFQWLPAN